MAYAYRELNKVAPDCGTSFTWTVKAFGPHVGWMCGWGLILATIIVLSNFAGVAVTFFWLFLGEITGNPGLVDLATNKPVNVLTCLAFVAVARWITYRGISGSSTSSSACRCSCSRIRRPRVHEGGPRGGPAWDQRRLVLAEPVRSALVRRLYPGPSLSIFIYWGWDTCRTLNEETAGSEKTPGRAALVTVITLVSTYLLVAIAAQAFAGVGDTGIGLGNPETGTNVFAALAEPVLGGLGVLLFIAVLASSAASLQTTFIPAARTLLAVGAYRALPEPFARATRCRPSRRCSPAWAPPSSTP